MNAMTFVGVTPPPSRSVPRRPPRRRRPASESPHPDRRLDGNAPSPMEQGEERSHGAGQAPREPPHSVSHLVVPTLHAVDDLLGGDARPRQENRHRAGMPPAVHVLTAKGI